MDNNKGFTLVEIITTVALISILMLLVIPNLLSQLSTKNQEASEQEAKILVEAARVYVDRHHELYENKTSDCIKLETLESEGLYSKSTRNKALPKNAAVKYSKNSKGATFTYSGSGC